MGRPTCRRALLAGMALGTATIVAWGSPGIERAAAIEPGLFNLAGNFYGDEHAEVVQYRQWTGADYVLEFEKLDGTVYATPYAREVGADFAPFTGDFNGDGYDDVYWNRAPTGPDRIWHMTSATDNTVTNVQKDGLHFVTTGDFTGDGADDILWYGPGSAADAIWEFDVGGAYTEHVITVDGDRRPYAGNFRPGGGDEVVWYAPGTAADTMWAFTLGTLTYTSTAVGPINSTNYQAYPLDTKDDGYDDIFWYGPGATVDSLWDYTAAGVTSSPTSVVNSEYVVTAGDLFADGHDDLLFQGDLTSIWDWHPDGAGTGLTYYSFGAGMRATGPSGRRDGSPLVFVPSGPPA